ncbi:MAG: amino acid adenylation domain-containing protein, partial [Bacteroidota bacterium]
MHHIASDGWSLPILVEELVELYAAKVEGRTASLPVLDIQYADYALWQKQYMEGAAIQKGLNYWKRQLDGVEILDLPTDFVRPTMQSSRGNTQSFQIDKDLSLALNALAARENVTMYMLLLSVLKVLLHRYSGQEDICVGSPVANRSHAEIESLIGFFLNTLALRSEVKGNVPFDQLLQQVKETTLQAYANQEVPFEKVVDQVAVGRDVSRSPLFQVFFTLQNTEVLPPIQLGEVELAVQPYTPSTAQFDLSFDMTETETGIELLIEYCTDLFEAETIVRIKEHLELLLAAVVADPKTSIDQLNMLSEAERQLILGLSTSENGLRFNEPEIDLDNLDPINVRFEAIAAANGEALAIAHGEDRWTYDELNLWANQIAHTLQDMNIAPGALIGVYQERSPKLIASLLAILKIGAIYVPLDTQNPKERIEKMINSSGLNTLLTNANLLEGFDSPKLKNVLLVDDYEAATTPAWMDQVIQLVDLPSIQSAATTNPVNCNQMDSWAYVLFTSGTTGEPKGAITRHDGALNHILAEYEALNLPDGFNFLQSAGIGSDISVWQFLAPLLKGGTVVVIDKMDLIDHECVVNVLDNESIHIVEFVPSYLWSLVDYLQGLAAPPALEQLQWLMMVGEALPVPLVKAWQNLFPHVRILNGYGPCEASDDIAQYEVVGALADNQARIPIGRPIANMNIVILDQQQNLCPIGVAGELCVTGIGVGAGYWKMPEKTAAAFLKNPFPELLGEVLYKTGDLARWLPDGTLDFIGRIDNQIKLRGHRIELGEIETVLRAQEAVKDTHVLIHGKRKNQEALIAFVVTDSSEDASAFEAELRASMQTNLPAYMQPNYYCFIEQMPVNLSDKVDRRKLLSIFEQYDFSGATERKGIVPPNTKVEKILAVIWEELLQLDGISVHDNFFELGGDSIVTIQVVSKMRKAGYQLAPRDMFQCQTIASLAALVTKNRQVILGEEGMLQGTAPLLPIQQWYFENEYCGEDHYNQALLFSVGKSIPSSHWPAAVQALIQHHDALRFSYEQKEGQWIQTYGDRQDTFERVDLSSTNMDDLSTAISETCQQYQASMDLKNGTMIKVVLLQTPDAELDNRLLVTIQHLAVDGVSWRILLDDFNQALSALAKGEAINLGPKTSSYRQWANFLQEYAQSTLVEQQQTYWKTINEAYQPLPVDHELAQSQMNDLVEYKLTLSHAKTQLLLQQAGQAYQTEIDDLLLAALTQTIGEWSGLDELVIGLEGHGRADLSDQIDISETVGWMTNLYPVGLQVASSAEKGQLIKSIKEQLRAVPAKGMGYGLLRYLHPNPEVNEPLSEGRWDIVFNYLGQTDQVLGQGEYLRPATESVGPMVSANYPKVHKLEIDGMIVNGQLQLSWGYNGQEFDQTTIEQLAQQYFDQLTQLIDHCVGQESKEWTASDYGLPPSVRFDEFENFLVETENGVPRRANIAHLSRLSPTQEGMLFHHLYDTDSKAYTEQLIVDLLEAPDLDALRAAWNHVIQQHSILQARILHEELNVPVLVVDKSVTLPFEVLDWSDLTSEQQDQQTQRFIERDMQRGFDFSQAPLMRITVLRLANDQYKMVWTYHHIILDGWSMPIVVESLLNAYNQIVQKKELLPTSVDRYDEFVNYLYAKNKYKEQRFWQEYLQDFDTPSLLPFVKHTTDRNKGQSEAADLYLHFENDFTQQVKQFAQANRLTVYTLLQGIWSFLLSKYTGNEDVAFGVTVSGRPADLDSSENRVGMFINTIPFRTQVDEKQSIVQWLEELQQGHARARAYQYSALNEVQNWAKIKGDFFDSILVFENYPMGEVLSQDWKLKLSNVEKYEQTNYLLTINVVLEEQLKIHFSYNQELLSPAYAELIQNHFAQALQALVNPIQTGATLATLEFLTTPERELILGQRSTPNGDWFNEGAKELGNDQPINVRFEATAADFANEWAVIHGQERWTYAQLNTWSNQIAHTLIETGVKAGSVVGVYLDRGPKMIAALIGILKRGAIYVPLDTQNPKERIEKMVNSSGIATVITSNGLLDGFTQLKANNLLLIDTYTGTSLPNWAEAETQLTDLTGIKVATSSNPPNLNELHSWAYVLYTSGSTGAPKGAISRHDGALNHLLAEYQAMELKEGFRFLQSAGIGSDISVWQMLGPLLRGGTVVVIDKYDLLDYDFVLQLLMEEKINLAEFVPSYTWGFINHIKEQEGALDWSHLQWIMLSGEAAPVRLVNDLKTHLPSVRVLNGYGPCEASDDIAQYEVAKVMDENERSVPIGRPIDNMNVVILDAQNRICPIGVLGELCITGIGVGAGYWGMPERTAATFVANPFSELLGETMYRTGDLARWTPQGLLDFLGRIDGQVKLRGHRIELGEVDAIVRNQDGVKDTHVLIYGQQEQQKSLVAFIVPQTDQDVLSLEAALRKRAQAGLPSYMQPNYYCFLDQLPVNLSDKVDQRKLIEYFEQQDFSESIFQENYTAPRNDVERDLAEIWCELLNVEQIGIYENFFELGGDSIITIQVVSKGRRAGYNLSPRDLFQCQTIASLAELVANRTRVVQSEQGVLEGDLDMLPIQEWYFENEYRGDDHYNQAFLFEVEKTVAPEHLAQAVEALVQQHDALRMTYRIEETGWQQSYGDRRATLEQIDLQQVAPEDLTKELLNV